MKTTMELQKRYLVFINRDKVLLSARHLCKTSALCALSSGWPQVSQSSWMLGFVAEAAAASQPSPGRN